MDRREFDEMTGAQLIEMFHAAENTEVRFTVDGRWMHREWTLRWNRGRGKQAGKVYVHLYADVDDLDGETGTYWRGGHGHHRGTADQQVKDFALLKIADWVAIEEADNARKNRS